MTSSGGYFGKREDNTTTEYLTKKKDLFALLERERREEIELVSCNIMPSGEVLMVQYKPVKEEPGRKSSLMIASWTTAMARVRLNRVLQEYAEDVIYADTGKSLPHCCLVYLTYEISFSDSAFIRVTKDKPGPEATGALGKLKDELEAAYPGKGARIVRMACTGAKAYSYIVVDRDGNFLGRDLKAKGITLQSRVEPYLPHEAYVGLLEGNPPLRVPQTLYKKNIPSNSVSVIDITKKVSFTSNKRVLLKDSPTWNTLPYGYRG